MTAEELRTAVAGLVRDAMVRYRGGAVVDAQIYAHAILALVLGEAARVADGCRPRHPATKVGALLEANIADIADRIRALIPETRHE